MAFYRCGGGGEKILPEYTVAINDQGYKVANKDGSCGSLFRDNSQVNQCILGNNIYYMERMFYNASNFNSLLFNGILPNVPKIECFGSSKINQSMTVTGDCTLLFNNCQYFDSDIIFDDSVNNVSCMFQRCSNLNLLNHTQSFWILPNLSNYNSMFKNCINLQIADYYSAGVFSQFKCDNIKLFVSDMWVTGTGFMIGNISNPVSMFEECKQLGYFKIGCLVEKNIIAGGVNVQNQYICLKDNCSRMFYNSFLSESSFNSSLGGPLLKGNLITNASNMFYNSKLKNINLEFGVEGYSMSPPRNFSNCFCNCTALIYANCFNDAGYYGYINRMFYNCYNLYQIGLPTNNDFKIISAVSCFENCTNFNQTINVNFDHGQTVSELNIAYMFKNCTALNSKINFTNHSNVNAAHTFDNCKKLAVTIDIPASFNSCMYMFQNCDNLVRINIHGNSTLNWANRNFYGFVLGRANTKRLNIWCNNQSAIIDHFPVNGTSLTWTTSGNAKYNTAANIYVYKNYSAV